MSFTKNFLKALYTRSRKQLSLALFMMVSLTASLSAIEPLIVGGEEDGKYLGENMEYLVDHENRLDIKDIVSGHKNDFQPCKSEIPAFGFSSSTYWFRLNVKNRLQTPVNWYMEFSYPMLDRISLYVQENSGEFEERIQGDMLPFEKRDFMYRNFIFSMKESPNSTQTYYFKIKTSSAVDVSVRSWSVEGLSKKINDEQTTLGGFVGIMIVMLVYNLILFLSIQDKSYIYYVLFVGAYTIFQVILNGLAFEYLWPNQVWWANNSLPLMASLSVAAAVQFARSFLSTQKKGLILDKIAMAFIAGSLGMGALGLFLNYSLAIRAASIIALLAVIFLIYVGSYFIYKKYRPAYYYMIAWTVFFAGVILFVLKTFGYAPDTFLTSWSIQIGSVLEVMLLSLGLGDRYNMLKKSKDQAELQFLENRLKMFDSVSRFVPNQFVKLLEKDSIMDVGLGDAMQKHMTVLFSDIRKFTNLSEQMTVDENFRFLNSYLKRMSTPIHNHGGFIDKFMGDAIMALFPESADHAIHSAIEIRKELKQYNKVRARQGYEPIDSGIGINTGFLMLGTVGSSTRLNTTVIGDTVNLAARVEALTKIFKVPVLISHFAYADIIDTSRYNLRQVDHVRVKGKEKPILLYELFDVDEDSIKEKKLESLEFFSQAMKAYADGEFTEAVELFRKCESICPDDTIPPIYIKRCEKLIESPPGENWRGVSRMAR